MWLYWGGGLCVPVSTAFPSWDLSPAIQGKSTKIYKLLPFSLSLSLSFGDYLIISHHNWKRKRCFSLTHDIRVSSCAFKSARLERQQTSTWRENRTAFNDFTRRENRERLTAMFWVEVRLITSFILACRRSVLQRITHTVRVCRAGWHRPCNIPQPALAPPPRERLRLLVCSKLCLIIALREVGRVSLSLSLWSSPVSIEQPRYHENSSIKETTQLNCGCPHCTGLSGQRSGNYEWVTFPKKRHLQYIYVLFLCTINE